MFLLSIKILLTSVIVGLMFLTVGVTIYEGFGDKRSRAFFTGVISLIIILCFFIVIASALAAVWVY